MNKDKADKKAENPAENNNEAEEFKDKWLRTLAEYENLKKRFEKEKIDFLRFSNERILTQLLPIIDDFDRAHDAARKHEHGEVFSKGVEMILNQLHKLLTDNGVEKIKSVREKFDPHLHEAIATIETDEHPEDTIVEEISPGYTISGRLLRAARVRISTGPDKDKKEGEEKNG